MAKTPLQKLVEVATRREIADLLRELYIVERRSDSEIASALSEIVGSEIPRSTVQTWRSQLAISREDRPPVSLSA